MGTVLASISLVAADKTLYKQEAKSYYEQAEDIRRAGYKDATQLLTAYPKVRYAWAPSHRNALFFQIAACGCLVKLPVQNMLRSL